MEDYKNLSGLSNVVAYEIGDDHITVKFDENPAFTYTTYKYSYDSAGKENVETMKDLAQEGWGLNSFINAKVRKLYEKATK
ncbi:MAG: hypothetical protein OEV93_03280 [Candidatus Moranbacteria bacterium]|nr:hypothetical protein [Candidatus Moranbacteria bacterium]